MISPLAHVDPSAKIGRDVTIHPFAFIDADTVIGDNCEIMSFVTINHGTRIGDNNRIYQGAIIGADPQDFRWDPAKPAICTIGNNNVIRENVIINRGFTSPDGTIIGDGCFIMAKTHIGHDCHIIGKTVLGNGVTIAGNVTVAKNCILSSNVIVHEDSNIGKWVLVKGGCRVAGNVPPYIILAHNPARYFGVNAYVLQRKGFREDEIDNIAKAYRHVYQSGQSVNNALNRISEDLPDSKIRTNIITFITQSHNRLVGISTDLE